VNILVVSLLRAGDLIMHFKALEDFAKNPKANIYILTHRQNRGLEFLAPWVKKFFYFDRELVQKSQKESFLTLDSGFLHTMRLISEINEIVFQSIYNFTNTKISAILLSFINGKNKIGLIQKANQFSINDPNRWIQYLNNTEHSKFHMIDVFKNSILETKSPYHVTVNEIPTKKEKIICIQPLTSDEKKNWPLPKWNAVIEQIKSQFADHKVVILSSNSEKVKLFDGLKKHMGNIFVSTYKEAYDLIARSSLLVTGDTSIKHLAALTETPVLELTLGSSRFNETGVYSINGYLIFKPVACQPCPHSCKCDNLYVCKNVILAEDVISAVSFILKRNQTVPPGLMKASLNRNSLLTYETISTDLNPLQNLQV
jgi:ADP-heptose:LPS heptosyltransferase